MNRKRAWASALGAAMTAGVLAAVCNHRTVPEEKLSTWHPSHFAGIKAAAVGPRVPSHVHQWIDCTSCAGQLSALQRALNVEVGLGAIVDGGYVSTPAPSYYLDGAVALLPDGGLFAPTIDEEVPHVHPTQAGRYRFDILDRDRDTVARLLDAGVGPSLPPPSAVWDPSWSDLSDAGSQ